MAQDDKLTTIRHSLAHVLAMAVLESDPGALLGIGPVIENGFYYDILTTKPIAQNQLPPLENKMRAFMKKNLAFIKEDVTIEKGEELFAAQPFKLELIADLVSEKKIAKVSTYKTGAFLDLCQGPHVNTTREIPADAFKLTKVAGAYWRGSEKNQMLTRIYGVAFATKKELDDYLKMMEEAERRDHRKLAKDLDLFMISEEVGKGLPLWLPNGMFIRKKLEDYMYEKEMKKGYKHVLTPVLAHENLYKTSGHLAHYKDDMYSPIDIEGEKYYLKPMNCPHHHMIFRHKPISYKELPLRLAEFGVVHRFERSGVLTGLIRARGFTQNDSHIYCTKDQLKSELLNVLKLFKEVYKDFDIKDFWYRLSLPDLSNEEKYGDIEDKHMWEESSKIAEDTLKAFKVKYVKQEGEASFYGPKIDIQTRNVMGKEDTIATVQLDFYSPKKFDLYYINEKGEKEHPVIIHRAIMGSFDRFFAFLVEKHAGIFPLWLAPIQMRILPIAKTHKKYAKEVWKTLSAKGIRAELKDSNDTIGKKIREGELHKVPYLLIVGDKEVKARSVAVRKTGTGDLGAVKLKKFIEQTLEKIEKKK